MTARNSLGLAGFLVGAALFALLFTNLEISGSDLVTAFYEMPLTLLVAITAMTLSVQVIGSLRWRRIMQWLAPGEHVMPVRIAITATSWGSFFGQVLPIQLAMPAARWIAARNGKSVGSTLYEGLFDFVILASGGTAAALVLLAGIDQISGLLVFCAAILGGCLGLRPSMKVLRGCCSFWVERNWLGSGRFEPLIRPLDRVIAAPNGLIASLALWSILKLGVLSARLLLIALVLSGPLDAATVAIGYPIVGLTLGIPFVPAGLGIADWSWTGILVLAGASASVAGTTAVLSRVLNFISLLAIVGCVLPAWSLLERSVRPVEALTSEPAA